MLFNTDFFTPNQNKRAQIQTNNNSVSLTVLHNKIRYVNIFV